MRPDETRRKKPCDPKAAAEVICIKRILIVASVYTGAGHQSIADALMEQFARMPDVEAQVIDGFEMMGQAGVRGSRIYGFLTRRAPAVYNTAWKVTMAHPPGFTVASRLCFRRFTDCIRHFHPDLILTVHSLFNATLTKMLRRQGLSIPLVVLQADLVDIHSTWCNPEARMTICPTREAYDASVRQGLSPDKLKVIGFPVRSRFFDAVREDGPEDFGASRPLRCLLMSGGEGSGNLKAYAKTILESTDAELTIICGRNRKLSGQLEESLKASYGSRVNILGFVPDIEREMLRSDLLIARASPNTLCEAVAVNLPLIMMGPLPEQEKGNPRLMQDHSLGVVCGSPADAPLILRSLLRNGAARLKEIRAAQHACCRPDSARNIAEYVAEMTEPQDYSL